MATNRKTDGPHPFHTFKFPFKEVQRALALKKATGRLNEEDTAEERAYIRYLLHNGLTIEQVSTKLTCPKVYVYGVKASGSFQTGPRKEPPAGYVSKLPDRNGEMDKAAYAKWLLKNGISPENTAKLLDKREAWVYQIISGSIHRQVRARAPDEEREVLVARPIEPPKPKAKKLPSREKIEAGYVIWLGQRYAGAPKIAKAIKVPGWDKHKVYLTLKGYRYGGAVATEPPADFYDVEVLKRVEPPRDPKPRREVHQRAAWIRWLNQEKGMTAVQIAKATDIPYPNVYTVLTGRIARGVEPEQPPLSFYKRDSLQR